ncbi:MAG: hypothetical protein ACLRMZ_25340 [Blautia marasmi]
MPNLGIYAVQKRLECIFEKQNDDHIGTGEGNSVVLEIPLKKAKEIMEMELRSRY